MKVPLTEYKCQRRKDILYFHEKFERIYAFRNGNACVGRLHHIVLFIIEDNLKMFYCCGLKGWTKKKDV